MPAAAAAPPSVPAIGERVRGATAEQVPPQLCVLLQVEVLVGEGSVVAWAGIVQVQSYADISNICIVNVDMIPF